MQVKKNLERGDIYIEAVRTSRSSLGPAVAPLRSKIHDGFWVFEDKEQAQIEALDLTLSRGNNLIYDVRRWL